jgi:hypothetical protein
MPTVSTVFAPLISTRCTVNHRPYSRTGSSHSRPDAVGFESGVRNRLAGRAASETPCATSSRASIRPIAARCPPSTCIFVIPSRNAGCKSAWRAYGAPAVWTTICAALAVAPVDVLPKPWKKRCIPDLSARNASRLKGAESLIPLLNDLIEQAARVGVQEIGLGMAHRGRLNVLHNVLDRSVIELFEHAAHEEIDVRRSGDVKYHQGFAPTWSPLAGRFGSPWPSTLRTWKSSIRWSSGWVRAQQQRRSDRDGSQVMPILIHGDAALAGQGVVMETLNMAATRGFRTGGTIHIVINNQIGFTTSDPRDSPAPACIAPM